MFFISKFSLIIITRCNLRCKLCCEYIPHNKPFPDMTVDEADNIMSAAFDVFDRMGTLHLTGGGEPFLHPHLTEITEIAIKYADKFDKLMLFTNSVTVVPDKLLRLLKQHNDKIIVQLSHYGINPKREQEATELFLDNGVNCKVEKYYGVDQSFGGWVSFGEWKAQDRTAVEVRRVFENCAVTRDMGGNWRTRNGTLHWCTRSQRGMELGLIPDNPDDYIDLLDISKSIQQKRDKFKRISKAKNILACNYCSGHQGTSDKSLRFPAAEQL